MNAPADQTPGSRWPTAASPIGPTAGYEEQREKITRATIGLIAKRGFNDTTVERICQEAAVSIPTFRKHFADKQDAFLGTFDQVVEAWRLRAEAALSGHEADPWAEQVAAVLEELLEAVAEEPLVARFCFVEPLTAGPEGLRRFEDAIHHGIEGLRLGRAEVTDQSALSPILEEMLLGGAAWVIHQRIALGETAELRELFPGLLERLVTPYIGEQAASGLIVSLRAASAGD